MSPVSEVFRPKAVRRLGKGFTDFRMPGFLMSLQQRCEVIQKFQLVAEKIGHFIEAGIQCKADFRIRVENGRRVAIVKDAGVSAPDAFIGRDSQLPRTDTHAVEIHLSRLGAAGKLSGNPGQSFFSIVLRPAGKPLMN